MEGSGHTLVTILDVRVHGPGESHQQNEPERRGPTRDPWGTLSPTHTNQIVYVSTLGTVQLIIPRQTRIWKQECMI